MDVILRTQLGQRLLAPDSRQGDLGLEYRGVIPSCSFHLLCSCYAHCALSFEQNSHLTVCLNFRSHFSRELNAQRDDAVRQKAAMAQIAQMVEKNRQSKGGGDIAYNFTHGTKIERIYVSAAVQDHLVAGRLAIVCQGGVTELVPRVIADKIAERDASLVVKVNKPNTEIDADDPYAGYQIPDDLTW